MSVANPDERGTSKDNSSKCDDFIMFSAKRTSDWYVSGIHLEMLISCSCLAHWRTAWLSVFLLDFEMFNWILLSCISKIDRNEYYIFLGKNIVNS